MHAHPGITLGCLFKLCSPGGESCAHTQRNPDSTMLIPYNYTQMQPTHSKHSHIRMPHLFLPIQPCSQLFPSIPLMPLMPKSFVPPPTSIKRAMLTPQSVVQTFVGNFPRNFKEQQIFHW